MPDYHTNGYDDLGDGAMLRKVQHGWKSAETLCGSGSEVAATIAIRAQLPEIMRGYGFQTIADVGAGDMNWMRHVALPAGVGYSGYDLHPRNLAVKKHDITKAPLPGRVDLILCRHVLNHMSIRMTEDAVKNMSETTGYLLITNCDNQQDYWDQYGFKMPGRLIDTYPDCQHWHLELFQL